jgi:hypothetical protein
MSTALANNFLPSFLRRTWPSICQAQEQLRLVCLFSVGLALAVLLAGTAHAGKLAALTASLPDVPAPPQGTVEWVARSMRLNGMPMTVKTFQAKLAPPDVFAYYERVASRWGHNEFRRSMRGGAELLAIRSQRYLVTIEARASISGSEGTITVSEAPERVKPVLTSRFPHPASARVVNRQEYEDDGIEAEHLSLASTRSPVVEAQAFVDALTRAGWQIARRQTMQTNGRGILIEAQRGAELAQLTLQPDQSRLATTAIVVVWRKA